MHLKRLRISSVSTQELGPLEIHRSSKSKLHGVEIYKSIKDKQGYFYLLLTMFNSCCITILDC